MGSLDGIAARRGLSWVRFGRIRGTPRWIYFFVVTVALKIVGAGFGRTGTLSLKAALEALGFGKCYHMTELLAHPEHVTYWEAARRGRPVDWDALFEGYQAAVDFPTYRHWRPLVQRYPQARVVLSVRDPETWYRSARRTIYRPETRLCDRLRLMAKLPFSRRARRLCRVFWMARQDLWQDCFCGRFEERAHALETFARHNDEVSQSVPRERLLVYHVAEGWEPLCRFLGVPVPEERPFPWLNTPVEFAHAKERLLRSV